MVYEYVVDVEHRCVRVRLSGVLTGSVLRSTLIDLRQHPRVTSGFSALIDLRDVRSVTGLNHDEVRVIASSARANATRRAFVAHNPAVFGVCRMFATYCELAHGGPVAVFRSVLDAANWLAVSADPDEQRQSDTRLVVADERPAMSLLSAHTHRHKLWQSGNLCCCLVSKTTPSDYWVQLCVNQQPSFEEHVHDRDEAARVAERYWTQHADAEKTPVNADVKL